MKAIVATLLAFGVLSLAAAQAGFGAPGQSTGRGSGSPQNNLPGPKLKPWRFQVRSADPWAIVALMEGIPIVSPELSTIMRGLGFPQQSAQAANSLVHGGHLMVNPTDNSIWFIPDR